MSKLGLVLSTLLLTAAVALATDRLELVQIEVTDSEIYEHMRHLVTQGYDFWTPVVVGANTTVLLTPERASQFQRFVNKHHISYHVLDVDLERAIEEERRDLGLHRVRRQAQRSGARIRDIVGRIVKFADIVSWVRQEVQNCSRCTLLDIGRSFNNRELLVVQVGNGYDRPGIFIDSGIHAREWIAPASSIYVLSKLIREYNKDPAITAIADRYNWYFLLMANPDGYDYTFNSKSTRFWRKNRSTSSSSRCVGVDLNRNFDIDFGRVASSTHACSDTYHGDYAFSEPESSAVANFILQRSNELIAYVTLHSFGQFLLVPYGYKLLTYPSDFAEMMRVANLTVNAIRKVNGKTFKAGNTADLLYPSSGGSDDWAKAVAQIKYSYTIELRPDGEPTKQGFQVHAKDVIPSGEELLQGLIAMAQAMQTS